jgi:hypothetical protein
MDLNYLYHRHGISLMMAEQAACKRSRNAHRSFATAYADEIADRVRRAWSAAA